MKAAYYKITEEKQTRIEQAAMEEFAHHSFNEASLNNIIKVAGISKGGMFKYIEDKTDLYLHVFEIALKKFFINQMNYLDVQEPCYITRIFKMVIDSRDFYLEEPLCFQLMVQATIDFNSPCYDQLAVMRHELLQGQVVLLKKNIEWDMYQFSQDHVIQYVSMLFQGININLLQLLTGDGFYDVEGYFKELDKIKEMTIKGLKGV